MKHRNQQLAQMIEQSAQRPAPGGSMRMSPLLRIDLREESVTEPAEPGGARSVQVLGTIGILVRYLGYCGQWNRLEVKRHQPHAYHCSCTLNFARIASLDLQSQVRLGGTWNRLLLPLRWLAGSADRLVEDAASAHTVFKAR